MNRLGGIGCALLALALCGCALNEVRSKTKIGPEFRHSGTSNTSKERWAVEQGFEFKWNHGVNTGLSYRRRDDNSGDGNNDNGVWFDVSFPIWKAKKKPDPLAEKIKALEERIVQLESQIHTEVEPQ